MNQFLCPGIRQLVGGMVGYDITLALIVGSGLVSILVLGYLAACYGMPMTGGIGIEGTLGRINSELSQVLYTSQGNSTSDTITPPRVRMPRKYFHDPDVVV